MTVIYGIIQQDSEELESNRSDDDDVAGDTTTLVLSTGTVMISSPACDIFLLLLLVYAIKSRHCLDSFVCLDVGFQDTKTLPSLLNGERQKAGLGLYYTILSFSFAVGVPEMYLR